MIPEGYENKVYIVDNLLSDYVLNLIKRNILGAPREMWQKHEDNEDYVKHRIELNSIQPSLTSHKYDAITSSVTDALFSKSNMKEMQKINDWAYSSVNLTNVHSTSITSHINGKPCGWHKNDINNFSGRIHSLNYILHIDIGNKFTGGELDVSYDNINEVPDGWYPESEPTVHQTVNYKDNRLVILPTDLWHTVRTIKTPTELYEPLDGRITINGHIGWKI